MSNPHVMMSTELGDILIELFPDKAPKTVENFLQYVDDGHYDGTVFHRVVRNFVIQGGGFTLTLEEKPTREAIVNEADNGLSNEKGTLSMARLPGKDTATSQFFINCGDNTPLDHRNDTDAGFGYAVFGRVVEGMDIVKKINWKVTKDTAEFADLPVDLVAVNSVSRFE